MPIDIARLQQDIEHIANVAGLRETVAQHKRSVQVVRLGEDPLAAGSMGELGEVPEDILIHAADFKDGVRCGQGDWPVFIAGVEYLPSFSQRVQDKGGRLQRVTYTVGVGELPAVESLTWDIEYAQMSVAGRDYTLPVRSVLKVRYEHGIRECVKSHFRGYHLFTGEARFYADRVGTP